MPIKTIIGDGEARAWRVAALLLTLLVGGISAKMLGVMETVSAAEKAYYEKSLAEHGQEIKQLQITFAEMRTLMATVVQQMATHNAKLDRIAERIQP